MPAIMWNDIGKYAYTMYIYVYIYIEREIGGDMYRILYNI